jgi:UDP-N-acetylglucosamine 2-epimerase (non-hydrolysing)
MLDQVLEAFHVEPDYDLDVMRPDQTLTALNSRLLASLEPVLSEVRPAMIVVQGDTTTTFSAALAGFYAGIPVSHVEAGLRTFDFHAPFPEEMNRTFTTRLADLHFAPTTRAAENLRREGIPADSIEVTGNTGIDAVLAIREALQRGDLPGMKAPLQPGKKLILVTAHRRESFGDGFCQITDAIRDLAARDDVEIVWPVHPNPQVSDVIRSRLREESNVRLLEPLEYVSFVDVMRRAYLILTDSGGIQEEAPSLGKPVLVLREKTERPEAVEAGTVKLVGCDHGAILREAVRLLDDRAEYDRMSRIHNPYGDGRASPRIARRIQDFLR